MQTPNNKLILDRNSALPLHKQIEHWLHQQIESGTYPPGSKLPSTKELREQLGGVNHLTIRQAIESLTKWGLLRSVKGKGTFITGGKEVINARSSRGTIGLICTSLADGFAHQVVIGAEAYLRQEGFELILCNTDYSVSNEADYLRKLYSRNIDGILLCPYMPPANVDLIESLRSNKENPLQMVCIDRGFPNSNIPLVQVDNKKAAKEAVSYLISLGHKRIGFIISSYSMLDSIGPIKQRFEGYKEALQEHDIEYSDELVQEVGASIASLRPQDVGLEHYGYQAMHKLLMLNDPPTGVFLLWDEIAPGAIAAIRNSNLNVPQDISIIGFNDDLLSRLLTPQLTTIHQPANQIGREAAQMLVSLIRKETVIEPHKTLSTRLTIRASTGPLKKALA